MKKGERSKRGKIILYLNVQKKELQASIARGRTASASVRRGNDEVILKAVSGSSEKGARAVLTPKGEENLKTKKRGRALPS